MGDEKSEFQFYYWTENRTNICYRDDDLNVSFCGLKDKCLGAGIWLPWLNESTWSWHSRAFLYTVGFLYSFLAVNIAAELFMGAVEKITEKTKKISISKNGDSNPEVVEVPVWNATVANLTLAALGTCAPEILLSVTGVVGNGFQAEKLGPSAIVGSAAFNLLVISAICISSISDGETKRIQQFPVFFVTSIFSMFAYLWLVVILDVSSKGVVEIWEALLTVLMFPYLVSVAYVADRGWLDLLCSKKTKSQSKEGQIELGFWSSGVGLPNNRENLFLVHGQVDKKALTSVIKDVKKRNPYIKEEEAAVAAALKVVDAQPKSLMWYRIGAIRRFTGGRRLMSGGKQVSLKNLEECSRDNSAILDIGFAGKTLVTSHEAVVEFHAISASVLENVGSFKVVICRRGKLTNTVSVRIESVGGTATEGEDFEPVDEVITFSPLEVEKEVEVKIIDDNQWEPDEEFYLRLCLVDGEDFDDVRLGLSRTMTITIVDDDEPGTFEFEKRGYLVGQSGEFVDLEVKRANGADGEVDLKWRTNNRSAIRGIDYEGNEGILHFNHGETKRVFRIDILNENEDKKGIDFEVELYDVNSGGLLGKDRKTIVTISNDDEFQGVLKRILEMTNERLVDMRSHHDTWTQQVKAAMLVNGGDIEGASVVDYILHLLTFGFKMIFSLVPPAGLLGGWPCFFVSLFLLGVLVVIIGDLANIFGCVVQLKEEVTAITFVALGTAMPDTFASRFAATTEKYADNAVGHITGSNSVSVFLGLGVPWLLASIYHAAAGTPGGFRVPGAGILSNSVLLYTVAALCWLTIMLLRRFCRFLGGGELGGPKIWKYGSAAVLVLLWLLYVIMSSLHSYDLTSSIL